MKKTMREALEKMSWDDDFTQLRVCAVYDLAPKIEAALRETAKEMRRHKEEVAGNEDCSDDCIDKCVTAGIEKLGEG